MAASPDLYKALLKQGPFPDQVDPWAEQGRYFHQIHSGMITSLIEQMQDTLLDKGYFLARETSLQIAEGVYPDIAIQRQPQPVEPAPAWSFRGIATAMQVKTDVFMTFEQPAIDAIFVKQVSTGNLITVIEVISPSNKDNPGMMDVYIARRTRLIEQRVHVVEIDLTRSVKRLNQHKAVHQFPYHIAFYLHDQPSELLPLSFDEKLKRIPIPLHGDGIPVELETAYRYACTHPPIAVQILNENGYSEDALPFPSLLSEQQRRHLLEKVEAWRAELARLRDNQEIG